MSAGHSPGRGKGRRPRSYVLPGGWWPAGRSRRNPVSRPASVRGGWVAGCLMPAGRRPVSPPGRRCPCCSGRRRSSGVGLTVRPSATDRCGVTPFRIWPIVGGRGPVRSLLTRLAVARPWRLVATRIGRQLAGETEIAAAKLDHVCDTTRSLNILGSGVPVRSRDRGRGWDGHCRPVSTLSVNGGRPQPTRRQTRSKIGVYAVRFSQ